MQFPNYVSFRNAVLKMIDGDNVNSQVISQDSLDLLIQLGESRASRELRCSAMEADLAVTIVDGKAAIPDDLLELKIVWFDPTKPLEIVAESDLRKRSQYASGNTRQVAQAGDHLIFLPGATDGDVLRGRYYARPPSLTTGAMPGAFTRYPEVYLFAVLAESAPFLGEDDRIPTWEGLYGKWLSAAQAQERLRIYSGSPLRIKAR